CAPRVAAGHFAHDSGRRAAVFGKVVRQQNRRGPPMGKFSSVGVALIIGGLWAGAAQAESRTFIIPNNPDGYGLDRCLANGEKCGAAVATSYCQSHAFAHASSFQKIDKDEITGAVPTSSHSACTGSCESYVAIICSR